MNILIVEDDRHLADALTKIITTEKYIADTVYDGADGLDYAILGGYDCIILDCMLPKMNGYEVAAELRRRKVTTPVLMLTARGEVSDKVKGLDSGADDYMTKPFAAEELLARIRSLTRRQGEVVLDVMEYGSLRLNLSDCVLSNADNGRNVRLSFKEFEILKILLRSPKTTVSKETLITKVWGGFAGAEDNNVEVYISFLRKKFLFLGAETEIETLRRLGYRLIKAGDK